MCLSRAVSLSRKNHNQAIMKLSTILPLLATLSSVNAKALLAVFEDEVTIGKSYKVSWLQNTAEEVFPPNQIPISILPFPLGDSEAM